MNKLGVEDCERAFHAALAEGDARGVEAALTLMAPQDPRRAQVLLDSLQLALAVRMAVGNRTCQSRSQYGHCGRVGKHDPPHVVPIGDGLGFGYERGGVQLGYGHLHGNTFVPGCSCHRTEVSEATGE